MDERPFANAMFTAQPPFFRPLTQKYNTIHGCFCSLYEPTMDPITFCNYTRLMYQHLVTTGPGSRRAVSPAFIAARASDPRPALGSSGSHSPADRALCLGCRFFTQRHFGAHGGSPARLC